MIQFDLHIHSIESKYKEGKGVVDNSTPENAEVLLEKLNEYNVNLFSITDHNRFNVKLYEKLDELISKKRFPKVLGLLAGVEFDVQMDPTMGKCHIITIFDAKNKNENYKKIYTAIERNKITGKNESYDRKKYEELLREIGLDVILIACQRNSLDNHSGKHNSLSESTMNPEELLMTGYINALEFQKPNVEGILKNNLKEIPRNILLVTGSDCHDWTVYPDHDMKNNNSQFVFSRANILPTFKGLLMAVTSPETRINQQENKNSDYIHEIIVNGKHYNLANGINAIIGENGSGKSTILKLLNSQNKDSKERYVKQLWEDNDMHCDNIGPSKRKYIAQGSIVENFDNNKLFPSENFIPIDHNKFKNTYKEFANQILEYIYKNIKAKETIDQLSKTKLEYNDLAYISTYFIRLDVDSDYDRIENEHTEYNNEIRELLTKISEIQEKSYYQSFSEEFKTIFELLKTIYNSIHVLYVNKEQEKRVKNIITSVSLNYKNNIKVLATSRENDQRDYLDNRKKFVQVVCEAIRNNCKSNIFPDLPKPIQGLSLNPMCGFSFNSEASYNNRNVLNEFLSQMFVKAYANFDALKGIKTKEELANAIKGCTDIDQIETIYEKNLNTFLEQLCVCKNYIVDISQGDKELGNTLGELSLAYFKYLVEYETEKCVFLIDQPEDHISNNNISKKLLTYFNSIRNKKQIIIVTHNPLLVVNQDVDQVLFVKKTNNKIYLLSGCLEYESEEYSILDIIANNMDGGKDSIEKRLRVYGKDN